MKTCNLDDFLEGIHPWLSTEYIRKAYLDDDGNFVVAFKDGVKNVYHINDCNEARLKAILTDFQEKGIAVVL